MVAFRLWRHPAELILLSQYIPKSYSRIRGYMLHDEDMELRITSPWAANWTKKVAPLQPPLDNFLIRQLTLCGG
jgi:hypothetical protein